MNLGQFLHQVMTNPGHALGQIIQQDVNLLPRLLTGHNVVGGAPVTASPLPAPNTPAMEFKAAPIGSPMLNHLYNAAVSNYNTNMNNQAGALPVVPSTFSNWNLGQVQIPYAPQLHVQPPTNFQPGLSPFDADQTTLNPFSFGSGNYFGSQQFNPQVRQ